MNNLTTRTITGFVFVICVVGSVILSQWAFAVLFLFIAIVGYWEFVKIMRIGKVYPHRLAGSILAIVLYSSFALAEFGIIPSETLLLNLLLLPALLMVELFRKSATPFLNASTGLLGLLWIILPMAMLNGFFNHEEGPGWLHGGALLGFFLILWIYDSGAYLVGSMMGRHHMMERISPKKSWEGFAGGLAAGLLTAFMISASFIEFTLAQWLMIAILIMIFGTLGDLVESMLKRSAGVKDSGSLLPGHGGVLDRFDAVFMAAPVVYLLIHFIR